MKTVKALVLTKYGRLGASSRMRTFQYLPWFEQAGLHITLQPLLSDELLSRRYQQNSYGLMPLLKAYVHRLSAMISRQQFDVVWIEKEALPWWPLWLELFMLRNVPYVLDYDDAIFHHYDQHTNSLVRRMFGHRLDGLMARAALVVCGNTYLAQRAHDAGAPWVEVIPTVIDLKRYPSPVRKLAEPPAHGALPRVVWIGSPSTVRYLEFIHEPLQVMTARQPFVLRVIGGGSVDLPGVQVEVVAWTEATEVEAISTCQVGLMPLIDSAWERGKCGYKLIQYMACGLPVIASSVGANREIIRHGESGFLTNSANDWLNFLDKLLKSTSLRKKMGEVGRHKVENGYSIQQFGPLAAQLLRSAADMR